LPRLSVSRSPLSVRGETLTTDRFGNLVSSIGTLRREGSTLNLDPWLPGCPSASLPWEDLRVRVEGSQDIPLAVTYAEVAPGALLAYVGSDGLLEIGVNRGRAVDLVGVPANVEIVLRSGG
jgi:S-adenosylmethionine hydrolase